MRLPTTPRAAATRWRAEQPPETCSAPFGARVARNYWGHQRQRFLRKGARETLKSRGMSRGFTSSSREPSVTGQRRGDPLGTCKFSDHGRGATTASPVHPAATLTANGVQQRRPRNSRDVVVLCCPVLERSWPSGPPLIPAARPRHVQDPRICNLAALPVAQLASVLPAIPFRAWLHRSQAFWERAATRNRSLVGQQSRTAPARGR